MAGRSADKAGFALAALARFYRTSLDEELGRHLTEPPELAALKLFQAAARDVPAYGEFLKAAGCDARASERRWP